MEIGRTVDVQNTYSVIGIHDRNFGLLGVGTILFAILIATPALADPGQFTGCLDTNKGTLYKIQAGSTPMSSCSKGDVVISFYDNNTVNEL